MAKTRMIRLYSRWRWPRRSSAHDAEAGAVAVVAPKPLFEGTPQNFKAPNLERPPAKMRPAFLAHQVR